jgi:ubiquinone/menaquinone biosynthesis C-methylase UbiE
MEKRFPRLVIGIFRFFFKHLYTTFAWAYDWVAWISSMGQWRRWQSVAVRRYPPGRVLELGHGPGHVLIDLSRLGNAPYGLDPSPQMSAIAARRLRLQSCALNLVRGRAESLPFKPGSFRTIIATFPSEYIFEESTLSEISRVLPEGGELIVVGVASITGRALYDRFASWLYRITGQSGEPEPAWIVPFKTKSLHPWIEIVEQSRARVVLFRAVKGRA